MCDEMEEKMVLLWEPLHWTKVTSPFPKELIEKCFDLYVVAAGADSVSKPEELWLRKYAESHHLHDYFDKNKIVPLPDACAAYKAALEKHGWAAWAGMAALECICVACKVCRADRVVSDSERAAFAKIAESWGFDPSKACAYAEEYASQEQTLIDKKMAIITGDADGNWTRVGGDGYGEGEATYLSLERMHFFKTDIPLTVADIKKQMECVAAIASEDGIGDLEKLWIERYAMYCGAPLLDFAAIPPIGSIKGIIEDIAARSGFDAKQLGAEMIFNSLRLVRIDTTTVRERAAIDKIASELGVEAVVDQLAEIVKEEYTFNDTMIAKMANIVSDVDLATMKAAIP